MLAQWAEPRSAVPAPGALSSPASVPVVRGGRAPRVTMWIALTLLGVASGIAGAFLGVWLALG